MSHLRFCRTIFSSTLSHDEIVCVAAHVATNFLINVVSGDSAEVRIPPLPPAEAGTRVSDPGGMPG